MKQTELGGAVVMNSEGKLLLICNGPRGSWTFSRGHVEGTESHLETATRELAEETGITDAELVGELGSYQKTVKKGKEIKTIHMFLFRSEASVFKPMESNVTAVRWVAFDEAIKTLTHATDVEFLKSIQDKLK